MKNLRYIAEAALVFSFLGLFRLLPLDLASNIGGFLARTIGLHTGTQRRADKHLKTAIPALTDQARSQILYKMWDHIGRTFAEYPHLTQIARARTEIVGADILKSVSGPAVLISGHIGNWEVMPVALLEQLGISMHPMYRAPNNPYIDRLLNRIRTQNGKLKSFAKSRMVIRPVMQALAQGEWVGILIDQKFNEGIESNFFGQPAMTSSAFVQLQERFNCPLVALRCERLGTTSRFRITATRLDLQGDTQSKVQAANNLLESWIQARPEQWLWPHRRWRKDALSLALQRNPD